MLDILYHIFIALLALAGFSLAAYIHIKKRREEFLVCPLDSNCHTVVHSEYSRFLGIPVELLGMLYYALVTIAYAFVSLLPTLYTPRIVLALLSLTTIAFIFSLYLTSVQMFIIKEWCTWCLISAGICIAIFTIGLATAEYGIQDLMGSIFS